MKPINQKREHLEELVEKFQRNLECVMYLLQGDLEPDIRLDLEDTKFKYKSLIEFLNGKLH